MFDSDIDQKTYKTGRVEIEGRLFQIEFWADLTFHAPYVRVSEIVTEPVRIHWFSRKTEVQEVKKVINSGWVTHNRLDWAMHKITEFLQREREEMDELRLIDEFCGVSTGE